MTYPTHLADPGCSTSPSVYVSIVGTAAVKDQCGPLGSTITDPIIALNPGELSTYEDTIVTSIGSKWYDANGVIGGVFVGTVKPWNFAAATSPTWGVGIRTSDNGDVYYTIGPPFLPLIVPPPQLLSLDPEWRSYCTGFLSNSPGLASFAVLDPPEILTPVAALTPAEVPAEETPILAVPARITPAAQLVKPTSPIIPKTTLVVVPLKPVSQAPKNPEPVSLLDDSSQDEADLSINSSPRQSGGPGKSDGLRQDSDPQQTEGPQQDQGSPQNEGPQQNESPPQDDSQQDKNSQQGDSSQQESGGQSVSQLDGTPQGDRSGGFRPNTTPQPGEGIDTQQESSNILQEDGAESNFPQGNVGGSDSTGQQDVNSHANQGKSSLRLDNNPQTSKGKDPQQDLESLARFILKAFDPDGQRVSSVPSPVIDEGSSDTSKGATLILSNGVLSLITPAAADDGGFSNNRDPPPPQAAGSRVLTLAGQTVLANPSATPLTGTEILPGGGNIVIPDTPIRLGPSGTLFVDGSSIPLHGNSAPPPKSIFTVEGQVFTPNPTGFVLAGSTVVPGGAPITISSIPISLGPSGTLFVGGDAIPLSNPSPLPSLPPNSVFVVGGEVFRANPIGFIVAGSKVLPGGAPVTVSGTPVSLDLAGTLFLGSTAIPLRQSPLNPPNSIFTVGGEVFALEPTGFIIAGSTVLPGGAPATVSGTRVSLNPAGELILGDSTIDLKTKSPATYLFTVGGQTFTANPRGFTIGESTIVHPGSPPITISGTLISLDPSSHLTIGNSTIDLSPLPTVPNAVNAINIYTFGTLTFTIQSSSAVLLDGKTLVPNGPAITVSGRRVSLNANGSLVVGSVVDGGGGGDGGGTLPVVETTKTGGSREGGEGGGGSSGGEGDGGGSSGGSGGGGGSVGGSSSIPSEPYTGGAQGRAAKGIPILFVWNMLVVVVGVRI